MKFPTAFPALILMLFFGSACHQSTHSVSKESPENGSYELTIEGPFQDLIYNRKENILDPDKLDLKAEYRTVTLSYGQERYEAQVRLRGGVRFCNAFPQLKLKLPKGKKIAGQKEFKIVTHGSYKLDPNIPVDVPSCDNDLDSEKDHRPDYAHENQIYDLATNVLPYFLNTIKVTVRYLDAEHGIDLRENAYFIEDVDHAAGRYGMKEKSLEGPHTQVSWRADPEDFINGMASYNLAMKLASDYRQLKKEQPELSALQISQQVMPSDFFEKFYPAYRDEADAQLEPLRADLKQKQLGLLQQFHLPSLAAAALFRIMLADSDWNILGMTNHSDGIKNFELITDGQLTFAIPYDFNESQFNMSDLIISRKDYLFRLKKLVEGLRMHDLGFVVAALEDQMPIMVQKLKAVRDRGELKASARESIDEFMAAVELYFTP